jgi:hypothetical protein
MPQIGAAPPDAVSVYAVASECEHSGRHVEANSPSGDKDVAFRQQLQ